MQEESEAVFVHLRALGKRERLADKAGQSLPERVVEAFNMAGLPFAFSGRPVMPCGNHVVVGAPQVGIGSFVSVAFGQSLPQLPTCPLAAVADGTGDNLAGAPALSQPYPMHFSPAAHKRPEFVEFQNVAFLSRQDSEGQLRQASGFF